MLKDQIRVYSVAGAAYYTYALIGQGASDSRRVRVDSLPGAPQLLVVKHSATGRGLDVVDRHLVQFSDTVLVNGTPRTSSVNLTLNAARDGFTLNRLKSLLDQTISFATSDWGDPGMTPSTYGVDDTWFSAIARGEN